MRFQETQQAEEVCFLGEKEGYARDGGGKGGYRLGCLQQLTIFLMQYRSLKDLRDVEYLAPRVADKLIFALIVMSL